MWRVHDRIYIFDLTMYFEYQLYVATVLTVYSHLNLLLQYLPLYTHTHAHAHHPQSV